MSISFKIRVSGNPVETEYPINVCTRVKRNHITFRKKVLDKDTQFAYLESPKIISNEAVRTVSYMDNYIEKFNSNVFSTKNNVIKTTASNLIFTTVTAGPESLSKPIFYGHRVPINAIHITFDPWNKVNVKDSFVYKENYKFLFSNLENQVDIKEGVYRASYVGYAIIASEEQVINYTEVFRGEPFFRELKYTDFDLVTGEINSNTPAYIKKYIGNGIWEYTLNKNADEVVYYKEELLSRPSVSIIQSSDTKQPWPLFLSGNRFTYNGTEYDWSDAEDNVWFPSYGFRQLKKEAIVLNERTIILPNKKIALSQNENCHITVKVIRNNQILFVKTTKGFLVDRRIQGSFVGSNIIRYEKFEGNVDYYNGVISLINTLPLKLTDRVVVEYVTEDKDGQKEIANLNPNQNKYFADCPVLILATPSEEDRPSSLIKIYLEKQKKITEGVLLDFFAIRAIDINESPIENTNGLKQYIGKDINTFIYDYCAIDPFKNIRSDILVLNNENKWIPLAFCTFLKDKYISKIEHKDARVFAGIKDDLAVERRGKDFTFSKILNPKEIYSLDLSNQVVVYIDRTGIPNWEQFDIEKVIKNNITANTITHMVYKDHPLIQKATSYIIPGESEGPEDDVLALKLIVNSVGNPYNTLMLYQCSDNNDYSSADICLGFVNINDGYDELAENPEETYTFPRTFEGKYIITFELNTLNISNLNGKLYFYLKWATGNIGAQLEELTNISPAAPIACVDTK